jgi:hypothetical protein
LAPFSPNRRPVDERALAASEADAGVAPNQRDRMDLGWSRRSKSSRPLCAARIGSAKVPRFLSSPPPKPPEEQDGEVSESGTSGIEKNIRGAGRPSEPQRELQDLNREREEYGHREESLDIPRRPPKRDQHSEGEEEKDVSDHLHDDHRNHWIVLSEFFGELPERNTVHDPSLGGIRPLGSGDCDQDYEKDQQSDRSVQDETYRPQSSVAFAVIQLSVSHRGDDNRAVGTH